MASGDDFIQREGRESSGQCLCLALRNTSALSAAERLGRREKENLINDSLAEASRRALRQQFLRKGF